MCNLPPEICVNLVFLIFLEWENDISINILISIQYINNFNIVLKTVIIMMSWRWRVYAVLYKPNVIVAYRQNGESTEWYANTCPQYQGIFMS